MSRSSRKPFAVITKKWTRFCEKAFRHRIKQTLQGYDPDRDWEELYLGYKGMEDYGTKLGFDCPPDESEDTRWHEEYKRLMRK